MPAHCLVCDPDADTGQLAGDDAAQEGDHRKYHADDDRKLEEGLFQSASGAVDRTGITAKSSTEAGTFGLKQRDQHQHE